MLQQQRVWHLKSYSEPVVVAFPLADVSVEAVLYCYEQHVMLHFVCSHSKTGHRLLAPQVLLTTNVPVGAGTPLHCQHSTAQQSSAEQSVHAHAAVLLCCCAAVLPCF